MILKISRPFLILFLIAVLWSVCLPRFGAAGEIAILQENFPARLSHADPVELRDFLASKPLEVQLITAEDLADPNKMNPATIDAVILPYGACFPLQARDAFVDYLKRGGAFVSLGGYAFDDLMEKKNGSWEKVDTDDPNQFLSGRRGQPGDWMRFQPDQIVIFDPTFPFKRVAFIEPNPAYFAKFNAEHETLTLEGFPATALTGNNTAVFAKPYARWIPLVQAYDRYHQPRGAVFSLMYHHDGPYKGSAWAFSGVTNVNLFSREHPGMLDMLHQALRAIRERVFLVDVELAPRASGPAEMELIVRAANFSGQPQKVSLAVHGAKEPDGQPWTLPPGAIMRQAHIFSENDFTENYTPVRAVLRKSLSGPEGDSVIYDSLVTAAVNPDVLRASGPQVTFTDNYFRVDGRPAFLFGTNQTGVMWFSPRENPATWDKDFSQMRRFGLRVLRVLHFSPYAAKGYEGQGIHTSLDLARKPPEKLIRQTDELVAMCARHGLILILTLHDWLDVDLTDEELEAQKTWNRFWAERYKDARHVLFDIQNEPSVRPPAQSDEGLMWNSFLQIKYGTVEKLREAWDRYAVEQSLSKIPPGPGPDEWENPRAVDHNEYRAWLLKRWIQGNTEGIRAGSLDSLATVGFLQFEWPADKFLSTSSLDFSNTHYHGPFDLFAPIFKLTDRRFRDQGLSVGELGAWAAHEARVQGRFEDSTETSIRHFFAVGHDTLGLGGAFALNWDLKDLDDCVFPWGLTCAQDGVPKDWYFAYRSLSYLFSRFQPQYEPPEIYFVIPDNHRLGAQTQKIHEALHRGLRLLIACHVNFGVINERSLDDLPMEANTLFWPIPYCPDDAVFEQVRRFVERGGILYFSGDIGFDPSRKPTRAARFEQLGLPPRQPQIPGFTDSPYGLTEWITARLGSGQVFYLPVPVELGPVNPAAWNPYADVFEQTHQKRMDVTPDDPALHRFSIPETNGNRIFTLFRCEAGEDSKAYRFDTGRGILTVSLRGWETGLLHLSRDGRPLAVEGTGEISWNTDTILETDAHVIVVDRDQRGLLESRQMVILPTRTGRMEIAAPALKNPVLEAGAWENESTWNSFGSEPFTREGNRIRFTIDPDMSMAMLLLVER
ncbi:MAG: cellulase family glycosylhydrolase [bacterium]